MAALQSRSTSAVVTLKASGRDPPAKLDGCRYASYGARYEGRIVQQLIKNGGGTGVYSETTPDMLGIWNTLLAGEADATWVFLGASLLAGNARCVCCCASAALARTEDRVLAR